MKKRGDISKVSPRSFGQIIQQEGRTIAVPDERFDRFYNYQPLPVLIQEDGFWRSKKRTKAIIGANQAGKTMSGLVEAIMIFTGIVPKALQGIYPHKIPSRPRHVRIIVGDYAKRYSENIEPFLTGPDYGMLPEAWSNYNPQDHMFVGPDGSYLSIMAIDPTEKTDPTVLRGPKLDHTMIDEISTEVCFGESLVRAAALKSGPRTVTLTYCAQNGFACWTYDRIYATCYDKLTKKRLPKEKQHTDIFAQTITMRDNPNISEETIRSFIASLREWEIPYRVYGEYSQRAQNPYFKMEMLLQWEKENRCYDGVQVRLVEDKVDVETGKFESHFDLAQGLRDDGTLWRMWNDPIEKHKYLCSVDCAEGNMDGDFSVADIWDFTNPSDIIQVAQFRTRSIKAGAFGVQAACGATLYNALLVPESLGAAGGIVVDRVRNYKNIYRRITVGRVSEDETERLGFHTGPMNKGTMLEDAYKILVQHNANKKCPIRSKQTLMELLSYEEQIQRDKFGVSRCVWGARLGYHDDCVMSLAIAARVGVHEHSKLSPCVLTRKVINSGLSKLEQGVKKANTTTGGAYSNMRPKKSLDELRRKYTVPAEDKNTRSVHGTR